MAVTKRTRYEVLRRDNYRCRYCGAGPEDGELTVDHVSPVALGGSDKPQNLVAACRDCNAGKAATAPGEALVEDVADDAARYAAARRRAIEELAATAESHDEYVAYVEDAFLSEVGWTLPAAGATTARKWAERGVPYSVIDAAAGATGRAYHVPSNRMVDYFCAVVWRRVDAIEARTDAIYRGAT